MKAILETPQGDCYAIPASEVRTLARLMRATFRVHRARDDEYHFDGMATGEVTLVPESAIRGLPARARRLRMRRLTVWYLASLTCVSYAIATCVSPRWMDGALIIGATVVTMWLRERDWI